MTDVITSSPAGGGLSPNTDIEITMEESSENGEELIENDEEGEHFEIKKNGLDCVGNQVLQVKSKDLEHAIEQVLGIESDDLENEDEEVLVIDSADLEDGEQVIEYESNDHDRVLNVQGDDNESNCNLMTEIPENENENNKDGNTLAFNDLASESHERSYLPPVVGMEFESYDNAYNYYNSYAKELGFAIRVKSSWTKRNSKEKRGAVLCCNCEGFKTMKEANTRRKETRTGCLAMIRLRLVESNRWRLDEVKLEHNHLFDPQRAQNSKSHKKVDAGMKRKLDRAIDVEVRTIKLYRAPEVDLTGYGSSNEGEIGNHVDQSKRLKLGKGDAQVLQSYFCQVQLTDPGFFYIMDLNDVGHVRNVFWIDSRSRASYAYFSDVVLVDTTCLSNKYEIPLLVFTGVNQHGQPVLLGCALLVDETLEIYIWLLRAWLTCMSGRPPQTIITDQCMALQIAIAEVFPRAHHHLSLPLVMQSIHEKLEVGESEIFRAVLSRTVYNSIKVEEFETAWKEMIQHFAIQGHDWLQRLYEDRERWVPAYLKDSFFAGISDISPFFHGYIHKSTNFRDFFDTYEFVLQKNHQKESLDNLETKSFIPVLKTSCNYELLLSQIYTKEIFLEFQDEVERMSNCFSVAQIHSNGTIITYMVREHGAKEDTRNFEVMYDKVGVEVRCICSCFNFRGYLCRHALCVLNCNRVEEIPSQYILPRWRKDVRRLYTPGSRANNIDISNPVQRFDHLHRRAIQVVEEGMRSRDHYMVAWQAFKESLNKVRLVAEDHV